MIDVATDQGIGKAGSSTSAATGLVGAPSSPSSSGGVKPSNFATIGKLTRNLKKGTGTLFVSVPGPGTLTLTGKGVKKATAKAASAGKVRLPVKATSKAGKRLAAKGRLKATVKIAFQPAGGDAASQSRTLSLIRT